MEMDVVYRLECPQFEGCIAIKVLTSFSMVLPIQNRMSIKKISTLVYPKISLAKLPLSHGDGLPFLETPDNFPLYSDDEGSVSSNSEEHQPSASRDTDYLPSTDSSKHKIKEVVLNDLNLQ